MATYIIIHLTDRDRERERDRNRERQRQRQRERNEQIVFTDLRVTQSMIGSRRGIYAIGSFIELFDNIVHWAVLQSFCHTGEPALVVVAQVCRCDMQSLRRLGNQWARSAFVSDEAAKVLQRLTRLSWRVGRRVWSRAWRYDRFGKMVLSEERWMDGLQLVALLGC